MGENTRAWKWMVGLLTLLNITLLIIIWHKPSDGPDRMQDGGPGKRIVHALNLTPAQENEFGKLKKEHHLSMIQLQEKGRETRDELFELLKQENPDMILVKEKIREIAKIQEEIELVTFTHFQQVRKLCTEEQKKKFDEIIKDVLHSMARPPRPGNNPHEK
ncbi:MAG: Spy/CpxP family protein refolding chaperone [Bacteroidia bacterium]